MKEKQIRMCLNDNQPDKITAHDAIRVYIERFGGYPYFMFMGADDEYVIGLIEEALKTGKEIQFDYEDDTDY